MISTTAVGFPKSKNNEDPPSACRPFDRDRDRDGFVFGEGGALLVIETEQHATARGAPIMGRLLGAAINSDGFHMIAPDPTGQERLPSARKTL
jgi:beta-ketoacyl ACP synthase